MEQAMHNALCRNRDMVRARYKLWPFTTTTMAIPTASYACLFFFFFRKKNRWKSINNLGRPIQDSKGRMVWPENSKNVFRNKTVPRSIILIPKTGQPQMVHQARSTAYLCVNLCYMKQSST